MLTGSATSRNILWFIKHKPFLWISLRAGIRRSTSKLPLDPVVYAHWVLTICRYRSPNTCAELGYIIRIDPLISLVTGWAPVRNLPGRLTSSSLKEQWTNITSESAFCSMRHTPIWGPVSIQLRPKIRIERRTAMSWTGMIN